MFMLREKEIGEHLCFDLSTINNRIKTWQINELNCLVLRKRTEVNGCVTHNIHGFSLICLLRKIIGHSLHLDDYSDKFLTIEDDDSIKPRA